jgi:hypothetical protein
MIDLETYITTKIGPLAQRVRPICPCCLLPHDAFALVRTDDLKWRCGNCRISAARQDAPAFELTWEDIRGARNVELEATDKYEFIPPVRASLTQAQRDAMDSYRQALRDLPQQYDTPSQVLWPVRPSLTQEP